MKLGCIVNRDGAYMCSLISVQLPVCAVIIRVRFFFFHFAIVRVRYVRLIGTGGL